MERIDKLIASQSPELSRRDVKDLIRKGEVKLNGKPVRSADEKADPERDEITVSGKKIGYKKHLYIMLNKPAGVVCATRDGLSEAVTDLLPPKLRRAGLFPAGRLDKDTVGFVLITDDGSLAHRILSPKNHVAKKYFVRLRDNISDGVTPLFESGMEISGDKLLPARIEKISEKECFLYIKEGKYHQIKRMFQATGNEVIYLKRLEIAGIHLDPDLEEGDCRELTKDEENLLKSC